MKLVAAAIAINEGRVLVTRRAPGQSLEGYWEFPGGKLEFMESPQQCIERELYEELGVAASAGEVITESIYDYPGGTIKLIAIEATLHDHDLQLTVHDAFEWISPELLLDLNLAPADIAIAEELIRRAGQG